MKLKASLFCEKDIPVKVDWMNDERINSTMYFDLPASIEKTINWFNANKGNTNRVDFSFFQEEETIGMAGFTHLDKKNSNAEFYIMIKPECQGQGYGKKISKWMCNYAFNHLHIHKIYLNTNDDNLKAYRIYEDCGFVLEGILREHTLKHGKLVNRRIYSLLKEEWKQLDWATANIEYEF